MSTPSIASTIAKHSKQLLALPGVVGISEGLCDDVPCIQVYVVTKTPELLKTLPDSLDGHLVRMIESGEIKAQ